MDAQHVDTEATMALVSLRLSLREIHGDLPPGTLHHEYVRPVLNVLKDACDQLDKGEHGKDAIRALMHLWQALELSKSGTTSDLREVVHRMYEKAKSEDAW